MGLQMVPSDLDAFAGGSVPLLHSQPSIINLGFLSNFYFPHLLWTNEGRQCSGENVHALVDCFVHFADCVYSAFCHDSKATEINYKGKEELF